MTARVEIYTTEFCGYCTRAKALLASKGVAFEEQKPAPVAVWSWLSCSPFPGVASAQHRI